MVGWMGISCLAAAGGSARAGSHSLHAAACSRPAIHAVMILISPLLHGASCTACMHYVVKPHSTRLRLLPLRFRPVHVLQASRVAGMEVAALAAATLT